MCPWFLIYPINREDCAVKRCTQQQIHTNRIKFIEESRREAYRQLCSDVAQADKQGFTMLVDLPASSTDDGCDTPWYACLHVVHPEGRHRFSAGLPVNLALPPNNLSEVVRDFLAAAIADSDCNLD